MMKFPFRQELVILIFLFPNSIQTGRMMEKYPHAKESQHRVHAGAPRSTAVVWLLGVILFHWRQKASCLGFFLSICKPPVTALGSTSTPRVLLLKQRVRHTWQSSQKTQWRWPSHHTADTTLSPCDRSISSDTPETVYPRSVGGGKIDVGRAGVTERDGQKRIQREERNKWSGER